MNSPQLNEAPDGNTALDEAEAAQLIPTHLVSRAQLNAWEQANINLAAAWLRQRRNSGPVLTIAFLKELHRRMFNKTWRWAGKFRATEKNLGVAPSLIAEQLRNLSLDTQHWIDHNTYPVDEIAARFHHRLVFIHPFPNGNGRHSRLATDVLLNSLGLPPLTWGSGDLIHEGNVRSAYLHALKQADRGRLEELIAFVRS